MKKILVSSTIAFGLFFTGVGQSSAASTINTVQSASTNIQNLDVETAMMAVQTQRAMLIDAQLKEQINTLSNSQQMDMLRLQSLSNKRNEAFDTRSNFIKKMHESRSAILTNMR